MYTPESLVATRVCMSRVFHNDIIIQYTITVLVLASIFPFTVWKKHVDYNV